MLHRHVLKFAGLALAHNKDTYLIPRSISLRNYAVAKDSFVWQLALPLVR